MKTLEYKHLKNALLVVFKVSLEYIFTQCKFEYIKPEKDSLLGCTMLPAYWYSQVERSWGLGFASSYCGKLNSPFMTRLYSIPLVCLQSASGWLKTSGEGTEDDSWQPLDTATNPKLFYQNTFSGFVRKPQKLSPMTKMSRHLVRWTVWSSDGDNISINPVWTAVSTGKTNFSINLV